jgi:hypothetical protein
MLARPEPTYSHVPGYSGVAARHEVLQKALLALVLLTSTRYRLLRTIRITASEQPNCRAHIEEQRGVLVKQTRMGTLAQPKAAVMPDERSCCCCCCTSPCTALLLSMPVTNQHVTQLLPVLALSERQELLGFDLSACPLQLST